MRVVVGRHSSQIDAVAANHLAASVGICCRSQKMARPWSLGEPWATVPLGGRCRQGTSHHPGEWTKPKRRYHARAPCRPSTYSLSKNLTFQFPQEGILPRGPLPRSSRRRRRGASPTGTTWPKNCRSSTRIGRASVRYVLAHTSPTSVTTIHGSPAWHGVGVDERERELEIVAVEVPGDRDPTLVLLVLHVMPTHYRRRPS